MPIDLSLYPKNWNQIANSIKQTANWTCEWCNKPCRPPGVSQKETEQWLKDNHPEWLPQLYKIVNDYEIGIIKIAKPQCFTLTTAHLDHDVTNCEAENLRALCSVCHLKLDRDDWNRTRKVRRMKLWEKHGQLTLDLVIGDT